MQARCGLAHPPLFAPAVIPAHRGMVVEVPLHLAPDAAAPRRSTGCATAWRDFYAGSAVVTVQRRTRPTNCCCAARWRRRTGSTSMSSAPADGSQARLVAVLDNLGKGASGAAVQNLNLMAGLPGDRGTAALSSQLHAFWAALCPNI